MKILKNTWIFEFSPRAQTQFKKLDPDIKKRIKKFLDRMIACEEPVKNHWKKLSGTHDHLYSARVGDYRILSEIKKGDLKILAISIGHRREVYKV